MYQPPTILQQSDITAIMQVSYSTEKTTFALREHFFPQVLPPERRYWKMVYWVRYIEGIIGELADSYPSLNAKVHKKRYRLGFIR